MKTTGEYLKQFSFDPRAESFKLSGLPLKEQKPYFRQNLKAYLNEVLADEPVSLPYHYYPGRNGDFFTDPSMKPVYNLYWQIDERERGGIVKNGINQILNKPLENPYQLIANYSPSGPASFDDKPNNPYGLLNYDYGQLYLFYYDNEKINSISVKIGDDGHEWVKELFENPEIDAGTQEAEIKFWLTNTYNAGNIDRFLLANRNKNRLIYNNKSRKYYLGDIIDLIRDGFSGKENNSGILFFENALDQMPESGIAEEDVFHAYMSVIYNYLHYNGQATLALSGSCGGSPITVDRVEKFLGLKNTLTDNPLKKLLSSLSSMGRVLFQTDAEINLNKSCIKCGSRNNVICGFCRECGENQ